MSIKMNNVIRLPFKAMQNWKRFQQREEAPCALASGLWRAFRNTPSELHVWSYDVAAEEIDYCDVQLEVPMPDGTTRQLFIMTVMTETFAETQLEIGAEFDAEGLDMGLYLYELDTPFTMPTILVTEKITGESLLQLVRAWAVRFWPDWQVSFIYGELTPTHQVWEGLVQGDLTLGEHVTHYDVLLQCDYRLAKTLETWASAYGSQVRVLGEYMVALINLPREIFKVFHQTWPDLIPIAPPAPHIEGRLIID
jgi:hypothetical protein